MTHLNPATPDPSADVAPILSCNSPDGYELEVLEGEDGAIRVRVDGVIPFSQCPEQPRHPKPQGPAARTLAAMLDQC
jgi:hypothetical protein